MPNSGNEIRKILRSSGITFIDEFEDSDPSFKGLIMQMQQIRQNVDVIANERLAKTIASIVRPTTTVACV